MYGIYKKILLAVLMLVFTANSALALDPMMEGRLNISGHVANRTYVNTSEKKGHGYLMKLENRFNLGVEYKVADCLVLFARGLYYYDAVYDAQSRYNNTRGLDLRQPGDEWLREAYVDYLSEKLDMRLGKQFVVWGAVDGVKILDKINPINYRDWVLNDERLPLWMWKIEYSPMVDATIQVLIIPDYAPNFIPPAGSPWSMRSSDIGAATLAALSPATALSLPTDKPRKSIENTKVALRWLNVINGFEYTINYFHGYNYSKTAYVTTTFAGDPWPATLEILDRYEKLDIVGCSFTKTLSSSSELIDGLTVRGEFAHLNNNKINYGRDMDIRGVVNTNDYNYCLGLDKYFWIKWLFSFQFIQYITDPRSTYGEDTGNVLLFGPTRGPWDKIETLMTLKVSTHFMHERLRPEVLVIYGDDNDWRISPKFSFDVTDSLKFILGGHIFSGETSTLNGQFNDRDIVFTEINYGF